jgi:prepilin-type N-terminal cleavage/methylation domain-containing protein
MRWRDGFSLAEVLVALTVLEVGLLGAAGTLVHATSVLRQARDVEWAVHGAREVVDSLAVNGAEGPGQRETEFGRIEWSVESAGQLTEVRVQVWRPGRDVPVVDVATLVSAAGEG